jgi:hypothetical protein
MLASDVKVAPIPTSLREPPGDDAATGYAKQVSTGRPMRRAAPGGRNERRRELPGSPPRPAGEVQHLRRESKPRSERGADEHDGERRQARTELP